MTDLGELAKIVDIEIKRNNNSITITQEKYIDTILKREGMDNTNPVSMPMDLNIKIQSNPDGSKGSRSNYYAKLLGELQFLTNFTRLDIAYTINKLAAYTENLSLQHVGALKQLLRYLKAMKNLGIIYSATSQNELQESNNLFHGYADAVYANMDDYKSVSGYFFIVGGGAITW